MADKKKFREMKAGSEEELLVHLADNALLFGVIKHDQLIGLQGEFTPDTVMEEMELEPNCRADVLESCSKTDHETAEMLDPKTAANIMVGGLKKGRTNPKAFLEALTTWRLVLFLGAQSIWRFFLTKVRWVDNSARKEHRALMAALLDKLIELDLLRDHTTGRNTCDAIVQAVGLKHFVSDKVPWEKREIALKLTYEHGKNAAKHILAELPPKDLVNWLKLDVLEPALIALAVKHGWEEIKPEQVEEVPSATDDKPARIETSGELVVGDDMVEEVSELDLEAEVPPPSSPAQLSSWDPPPGDDLDGLGEGVEEAMEAVTGAPPPVRDTPKSFLAGRPSDQGTGPQPAQKEGPSDEDDKKEEKPLW